MELSEKHLFGEVVACLLSQCYPTKKHEGALMLIGLMSLHDEDIEKIIKEISRENAQWNILMLF